MRTILNTPLREQAGSMAYNRFEYQTTWSLSHMIKKFARNEQFFVFCEFHDDVSEIENCSTNQKMIFYQVKTQNNGNFTFKKLTQKTKSKQHSFIGYLFYNFLKFGDECSASYFVSNRPFDEKISKWKISVDNGLDLSTSDATLYKEIKDTLKEEYPEPQITRETFDSIFNVFIKNTHFCTTSLSLDKHTNEVRLEFLNELKFKNIYLPTAYQIFDFLNNEVRRKAQTKIEFPISFNDLKKAKGMDNSIFDPIEKLINEKPILDFINELSNFPLNSLKIIKLKKAYKKYNEYSIDLKNIAYNKLLNDYQDFCNETISEIYNDIDELSELIEYFNQSIIKNPILDKKIFNHPLITNDTLEALFYYEFITFE